MENKDFIIQWLAEQCAERLGCWDVNGAHPCGEDCVDCWIRRAAKEVDGEVVKDPAWQGGVVVD